MSSIGGWSEQQLRNFIQQVQRDSPPQQSAVSHDTVNVGSSLIVNGQPIVGPNAFKYRFSATSGRGVPQGAFADTTETTARANAIYKDQAPAYQFYQSFERIFANGAFNYSSSIAVNGGAAIGSAVYVPVDCTLQAAGFFLTNTPVAANLTIQSCALYGPWDTGPLIGGTSPALVAQTANRANNVIALANAGSIYPFGTAGLAEYPLPNVFLRAGVYYPLFSLGGSATNPHLLSWDVVAAGSGGINANVLGSFFGEPYPSISGTSPIDFTAGGWPANLVSGVTSQQLITWTYIKTS